MRAVIFDLDGTLADSLGDIGGAMNEALAARGLPVHALTDYHLFIGEGVEVLARKAGYREVVRIDFESALANEPCVEVRGIGVAGDNHYNTPRNPPYYVSVPGSVAELYLRKSVAAKLGEVGRSRAKF